MYLTAAANSEVLSFMLLQFNVIILRFLMLNTLLLLFLLLLLLHFDVSMLAELFLFGLLTFSRPSAGRRFTSQSKQNPLDANTHTHTIRRH
jgi:hypothetical protein